MSVTQTLITRGSTAPELVKVRSQLLNTYLMPGLSVSVKSWGQSTHMFAGPTTATTTTSTPTTTTTTTSTTTVTTISTAKRVPPSRNCAKCVGNKKSGTLTCCGRGGAWFDNCGNPGDTDFDYTWGQGIRACKSKLVTDCM